MHRDLGVEQVVFQNACIDEERAERKENGRDGRWRSGAHTKNRACRSVKARVFSALSSRIMERVFKDEAGGIFACIGNGK